MADRGKSDCILCISFCECKSSKFFVRSAQRRGTTPLSTRLSHTLFHHSKQATMTEHDSLDSVSLFL